MNPSQHSKILRELKNNKRGVPNYRFPQLGILSYTKRIQELRRDGHPITTERQYINGRATGVWMYYLNEDAK